MLRYTLLVARFLSSILILYSVQSTEYGEDVHEMFIQTAGQIRYCRQPQYRWIRDPSTPGSMRKLTVRRVALLCTDPAANP